MQRRFKTLIGIMLVLGMLIPRMVRGDSQSLRWKIGEVIQVLVNPEGRRDGILVTDNDSKQTAVIKIPPHLWGETVTFNPGETVAFAGTEILTAPNLVFDRAIVKKGNSLLLDDTRGGSLEKNFGAKRAMALPLQGAGMQTLRVNSTLMAVSANPEGKVDRLILADGSCVDIPMAIEPGREFRPQLGERVRVAGVGTEFDGKKSIRADDFGLAE